MKAVNWKSLLRKKLVSCPHSAKCMARLCFRMTVKHTETTNDLPHICNAFIRWRSHEGVWRSNLTNFQQEKQKHPGAPPFAGPKYNPDNSLSVALLSSFGAHRNLSLWKNASDFFPQLRLEEAEAWANNNDTLRDCRPFSFLFYK